MGDALAGDVPLDFGSIQIFPNQNRYEAFAYREEQVEKVAAGFLEHLSRHLPGINDLCAKGLDANFDLKSPENLHDVEWFTKATVKRFLDVVGSPDLIDTINAIINEMSQLEESKNFHLSLYGKDQKHHLEGEEEDGSSSTDMAPSSKIQVNTTSSDASKNELLRAMDLRFSALSKELATTFSKATNCTCFPKDIIHLAKFSQQFGATEIGNSLSKLIELNQKSKDVGPLNNEPALSICNVANDDSNRVSKNSQISKPIHQETPVKYGVSPAKAAQVERQSSAESEESSYSSDEGQASAERSRSLTRTATPRRSASPMRRVQIGRTGPRRAAALTIKSLNFIPARERATSYRDAATNGCEEEISEKPCKKPEIDVRRITVQDAINLFESKQRDQVTDIQTRRSLPDASVSTNKSVLRRWSSSMGENSVQCQPQIDSEDSVSATSNDVADVKNQKSIEGEVVSDFVSQSHNYNDIIENIVKPKREENVRSHTVDNQAETDPDLVKETRKLAASAEWNQQKQAEYNEILMKMMESKSVKFGKSQPRKNQNITAEQRGSYDDYKEKRDAKLQGGNTRKKVEKEAQFKAMQQITDKRKAEMVSNNGNGTKKTTTRKPQKSLRNSTQPANSPMEASKSAVTKKVSSKTSPLPATCKSWSATPSSRVVGTSPAKVRGGVSSASTTPTHRKPQSAVSVPSPQKERAQQRIRKEKETQTNNVRSLKSKNEKPAATNNGKEMKEKVTNASVDSSAPSKISSTNKGTKKSSVVPVESKPFLRKGSRTGQSTGITSKKKISPKPEESPRDNGVPVEAQETGLVVNTSDLLTPHSDRDSVTPNNQTAVIESECQINSHLQSGETYNVDQVPTEVDVSTNLEWSSLNTNTEEESTIPPSAWEEIEEHLELPKTCEDGSFQPASPANIISAELASPRVHHSLSQMLQEESSEPDTCEWGNAENPPAMIYQKDAPKGLKRLLKFARKSKGDTNSTGWSSPSVFSEGEDDGEESKNSAKRNAENLLRKAALHAKSYGQPKSSLHEGYDKILDLSKPDSKGTHKMQGGRDFGAGPTTKGTRSFFSLSAFRGSKTSEAKYH